jgi:hypothetical protein
MLKLLFRIMSIPMIASTWRPKDLSKNERSDSEDRRQRRRFTAPEKQVVECRSALLIEADYLAIQNGAARH